MHGNTIVWIKLNGNGIAKYENDKEWNNHNISNAPTIVFWRTSQDYIIPNHDNHNSMVAEVLVIHQKIFTYWDQGEYILFK